MIMIFVSPLQTKATIESFWSPLPILPINLGFFQHFGMVRLHPGKEIDPIAKTKNAIVIDKTMMVEGKDQNNFKEILTFSRTHPSRPSSSLELSQSFLEPL